MYESYAPSRKKIPHIGMRMVKSIAAVFLCFLIHIVRGNSGDVFQYVISTLFCIQQHVNNSKKAAVNRILGTLVGAAFGALAVMAQVYIFPPGMYEGILGYAFITIMIIPVMYTTILLGLREIAYFSSVVFLTIALVYIDSDPAVFIFNRLIDTLIGVFVAIGVNAFKLPRKYHNNILFITNLDDTLLDMRETLSPYSKIELNKMLEEGAQFTVSTHRTPASLVEVTSEIDLNLPVIAMDGSVLYDIAENQYLKVYVISAKTVRKVLDFINPYGINFFINAIVGDIMLTFCPEALTDIEENLYWKYKKSPYRHYVRGNLPKMQNAIYLMALSDQSKIEVVAEELRNQHFSAHLKIKTEKAKDFPGYYYIKVFNKNASRENMIEYLKCCTKSEQVVTFGSIEGKYDVVINNEDTNEVIRAMKKIYKPIWYKK